MKIRNPLIQTLRGVQSRDDTAKIVYSGEAEGYMARSDDCHKIYLSELVGARKPESIT